MRVKIKQRIERMGMTVADVADLTGVKRQYLYRVISGATTPSVKYVLKLCTVLKCIAEDLFELELKDTYKFLVITLLILGISFGTVTSFVNQSVSHNLYYVNSILSSLKRRLRLSINQLVEFFKLCKLYQRNQFRRSQCLNQQ